VRAPTRLPFVAEKFRFWPRLVESLLGESWWFRQWYDWRCTRSLIGATLGWADFCTQVDNDCLRITPEILIEETRDHGSSKLNSILGLGCVCLANWEDAVSSVSISLLTIAGFEVTHFNPLLQKQLSQLVRSASQYPLEHASFSFGEPSGRAVQDAEPSGPTPDIYLVR
jgi:hypothetical protein